MDHQVSDFSRILFVAGTGRSGTNITKQIFSKHADVASLPFEYRFTIDPGGILDFYNTYPQAWTPFWVDQKISGFIDYLKSLGHQDENKKTRTEKARQEDPRGLRIAPPPYGGWELEKWIPDYFESIQQLEKELVSFRYAGVWPGTKEGSRSNEMIFAPHRTKDELLPILQGFLDRLNRSILQAQQSRVFLEDNTHSILFANDLLDLYPNSRLLHIVRDPRDVMASVIKQRWTPTQLEHVIDWYNEIIRRWDSVYPLADQKRIKTIQFESLVTDKIAIIKNVCEFFELDYSPVLAATDLSGHNMGNYKNAFNAKELDLIDRLIAPSAKSYYV